MGLSSKYAPHYVSISEATAATHEIVAAVAGKSIRVTNVLFSTASGQTAIWRSGSADISGPIAESYSTGDNELGILATNEGEALNLVLSAAVQVSGHLVYVLMPVPPDLS